MVLFSKLSISQWRLPRRPLRPLCGLTIIVDWVFSPHEQSKILGDAGGGFQCYAKSYCVLLKTSGEASDTTYRAIIPKGWIPIELRRNKDRGLSTINTRTEWREPWDLACCGADSTVRSSDPRAPCASEILPVPGAHHTAFSASIHPFFVRVKPKAVSGVPKPTGHQQAKSTTTVTLPDLIHQLHEFDICIAG
ncbi:hypothetical protein FocTR4_00008585 [Fusarium oxysporum f. sp. cubense]|uniref:Uncharacterized protein n=1 Tax=Fusarium oxysporum f. sp. cubense TaxID=61366 RepID=A0A5C6SRI6_FUSOC|nr:hypothetical protein FocTR4_00008585 [Fusarium oxysporum f. sp. cubense]